MKRSLSQTAMMQKRFIETIGKKESAGFTSAFIYS